MIVAFTWADGFIMPGCEDGWPIMPGAFGGLYPFRVRVVAYKGSPREWADHLAPQELIQQIINGDRLEGEALTLYFPERWLGAVEIVEFMDTLAKKHAYLSHVSLMTANPIILTDFPNAVISVMESLN